MIHGYVIDPYGYIRLIESFFVPMSIITIYSILNTIYNGQFASVIDNMHWIGSVVYISQVREQQYVLCQIDVRFKRVYGAKQKGQTKRRGYVGTNKASCHIAS